MDLNSLIDGKSVHRLHAKAVRAELAKTKPDAAPHAAANFLRAIAPMPSAVIAIYRSVGSELDTWPLAEELLQRDYQVCLPVVTAKNKSLMFRPYTLDTELEEGMLGIPVPPEDAGNVIPDIILCPLLAFTKHGYRLGMGGGFYDRTLEQLRTTSAPVAVGFAFAGQEVPSLPKEKHDEKLDWMVTEQDAWRTS